MPTVTLSAGRRRYPPEADHLRLSRHLLGEVVRADTDDSGEAQSRPDAIMSERRKLINLTYRLLGSLAEAEDAVQESYARWYALSGQQQEAIKAPGAWLKTVASRICLNALGPSLRSKAARRSPATWPASRARGRA
jgi:DNA-directed RNA polymerase specialized sigma24 family protein